MKVSEGLMGQEKCCLGRAHSGEEKDFQISRPPKWELVSFWGSTGFICTNLVSELGLITSLEGKRTPQRQINQKKLSVMF